MLRNSTNKKTLKRDSQAGGFSILEVMVSLGLLTVGILGALSLVGGNISSAMYSREQITAFYLAQEAIEYARNILHKNDAPDYSSNFNQWINGTAANAIDLSNCNSAGSGIGCRFDVIVGGTPVKCNSTSDADCPALKYDNTNGVYSFTGTKGTAFKRWLKITKSPIGGGENEALLEATVQWVVPGDATKEVTLQEYVYNFNPQ